MNPVTLILLHAPETAPDTRSPVDGHASRDVSGASQADGGGWSGGAGEWGVLVPRLREYGLKVVAPHVPDAVGMRYVAGVSLAVSAADPGPPLLLVAQGAAGPLLPAVAVAQRAAHRAVGGYVFVDADLPTPGPRDEHDHRHAAPLPVDWPDAPCGYLHLSPEHDQDARVAALRGWPVHRPEDPHDLAASLVSLIADL